MSARSSGTHPSRLRPARSVDALDAGHVRLQDLLGFGGREDAYCAEHVLPDGFRERANRFAPNHVDSFHIARAAGVTIASGSDQGPPREAALLEIDFLARTGLGAHGAIVAATRTAGEVCQASDQLGTIEPGKLADLIAVTVKGLTIEFNAGRDLSPVSAPELLSAL